MSEFSIEESIGRACAAMNFHPSVKDRLLAELARLRAVEEAWRAVVMAQDRDAEVVKQLIRLDQMKGEVRT